MNGLFLTTHINVAIDQIYMLPLTIVAIHTWSVQTHKSVAMIKHYALQLCNGYYHMLPTHK
jgi:hypothetical protein